MHAPFGGKGEDQRTMGAACMVELVPAWLASSAFVHFSHALLVCSRLCDALLNAAVMCWLIYHV
jgi:cytochrome bd-type quinol oxidase subunit 1